MHSLGLFLFVSLRCDSNLFQCTSLRCCVQRNDISRQIPQLGYRLPQRYSSMPTSICNSKASLNTISSMRMRSNFSVIGKNTLRKKLFVANQVEQLFRLSYTSHQHHHVLCIYQKCESATEVQMEQMQCKEQSIVL